jgi:hypothetical protein
MPLSRLTTSCLRAQQPPNPLLRSLLSSPSSPVCTPSPRRPFSELTPQHHAQAALASATRKDEPPAPSFSNPQHSQQQRPRHPPGSRVFNYQSPAPSGRGADPARNGQRQGQGQGDNSYALVREAQRRWQQGRRAHAAGQQPPRPPRPNAAAAGVLDGMLESILPPAVAPRPSSAAARPRVDFAARWAAEVKAMDRDLALAPRDAYATRVRSSLGSNAVTVALRKMKRLVHESEMRKKLFAERAHERPGLRRKRLKMVRWRRRFAGDFRRICQRANKLAGQGW